MRVTLERETTERTRKGGYSHLVTVWKPAWTGEVLYADSDFIVIRSAGSHQTFHGVPSAARLKKPHPGSWDQDGGIRASMWGHDPKHPVVARLGLERDRWGRLRIGTLRISPKSARNLRKAIDASGRGFFDRGTEALLKVARWGERYVKKVQRGIAARSGKSPSCKLTRSPRRSRKA